MTGLWSLYDEGVCCKETSGREAIFIIMWIQNTLLNVMSNVVLQDVSFLFLQAMVVNYSGFVL